MLSTFSILLIENDEDIICPRCNCLTPRKEFVVTEEEEKEEENTLEAKFQKAIARLGLLEKKPSTDIQLQLYGLYSQVNKGDCNTPRPGMTNLEKRYKWDAWNSRKGMTKEQAMNEYIALVDKLTQ